MKDWDLPLTVYHLDPAPNPKSVRLFAFLQRSKSLIGP